MDGRKGGDQVVLLPDYAFEFYGQKLSAFETWSGYLGYFVVLRNLEGARLRRLVTELTGGGQDLAGLPRHKTGLVDRLRELGRHEEAVRIENGAGFSLYAGDDGVVWIISGGRRERLFGDVKRGE